MKNKADKKRYSTPQLVKYGDFEKLTAGTRTKSNEISSQSGTNKTRTNSG